MKPRRHTSQRDGGPVVIVTPFSKPAAILITLSLLLIAALGAYSWSLREKQKRAPESVPEVPVPAVSAPEPVPAPPVDNTLQHELQDTKHQVQELEQQLQTLRRETEASAKAASTATKEQERAKERKPAPQQIVIPVPVPDWNDYERPSRPRRKRQARRAPRYEPPPVYYEPAPRATSPVAWDPPAPVHRPRRSNELPAAPPHGSGSLYGPLSTHDMD